GRSAAPPLPLAGHRLPAGGALRAAAHRPALGRPRRVHAGQRPGPRQRGLPGRLGVGGAGPRRARPGLLHARVARTAAPPGRGGLRPPAVAGRAAADVRAHAAGGPDPRLLPGAGRFAARPVGRRRPDDLPDPALAGRRVAALVGPFRSVPGGADRTEGCEECEHCAMRRLLLSATAALLWLGVAAAPASAHSVSGVSATNFHTHLKSVTPAVPGLEVKVVEAGSRL